MLPPEAIREYQETFSKDFGYEISKEEALQQLTGLMDLVKLFYKRQPCIDFREKQ
ncbi:MAG: hypothetical protein ABIJ85_01120 [bacterium]